ncbi:MAG: transglutaminase-like cysteine peptidase [Proteobacteria bacterium]|nr:transglutaminase-like cysteine peptidase [Pseudomonadota bacterium]
MFNSFRYWLGAALLGLLVAGAPIRPGHAQTLADLTGAARSSGAGLFGSLEFKSNSLKALPQWRRVLASFPVERAAFDRCLADPAACTSPTQKNWRRMVRSAAKLAPRERLTAVNDFFNRWPYRQDAELYGRSEYWATPREFMSRSGDCEDYAIAKYFALRTLGFGREALRIVVLKDRIRGIGHAVLAVYLADDTLILDNLSSLIVSHSRYKHYVPQVSMNETTRWAHVGGNREGERQPYRGLYAQKQ